MARRCPYCKEYIQDDAIKCRYCGERIDPVQQENIRQNPVGCEREMPRTDHSVHPITGEPMRPRPRNNLVWAVLSTVLCCVPFGVVSIVYASKVDDEYAKGNILNSYKMAEKSVNWMIASIVLGLIGSITYIILTVVAEVL